MSPSQPNTLDSTLSWRREAGIPGPQQEFIPKQKKINTKKCLLLCIAAGCCLCLHNSAAGCDPQKVKVWPGYLVIKHSIRLPEVHLHTLLTQVSNNSLAVTWISSTGQQQKERSSVNRTCTSPKLTNVWATGVVWFCVIHSSLGQKPSFWRQLIFFQDPLFLSPCLQNQQEQICEVLLTLLPFWTLQLFLPISTNSVIFQSILPETSACSGRAYLNIKADAITSQVKQSCWKEDESSTFIPFLILHQISEKKSSFLLSLCYSHDQNSSLSSFCCCVRWSEIIWKEGIEYEEKHICADIAWSSIWDRGYFDFPEQLLLNIA